MTKVSNGYVMGFLCGYMKDRMDPGTFGYHRGYTVRKQAAEAAANAASAINTQPPEQLGDGLAKPTSQVWMPDPPASYPGKQVVNRNAKPKPMVP